jgi:cation:H+ antiporter
LCSFLKRIQNVPAVSLIILGSVILYFSSEILVKGASSAANKLKLSQFFTGLTIVAFATSAPEFFVSLISAIRGHSDISFGNIIGSNIVNIGLVLGTAFLILEKNKFLNIKVRDLIFLTLSTLFLLIAVILGWISRLFALFSIIVFIIFIYNAFKKSKTTASDEPTLSWKKDIIFILLGAVGLPLGANIFIKGGVLFATIIGLSEIFIGVTIMAVGTSLPELAASIVASLKKNHGISIGNVVGSNIFNVFAVLGLVGLIRPIKVSKDFLSLDIPFLIILSFLTCLFLSRKNTRHYFGGIIIATYLAYIILVLYRG